MGVRINTNVEAINAQRNFSLTASSFAKSVEKLSSGLRINRAADDAAGLTISEKLRGQAAGLNQASRNAQDGISLIQTAEGALNETTSILQRMRKLSVQSSSDTLTDSDRTAIQKEVSSLKSEIDRIANTTEFNTKKLLNGNISGAATAQGTVLQSVCLWDGGGAADATGATLLTDLGSTVNATTGNSFGLQVGDVINIDGIKNGTAITTATVTIGAGTTVTDPMTAIDTAFGSTSSVDSSGNIVITGANGTANALIQKFSALETAMAKHQQQAAAIGATLAGLGGSNSSSSAS